MPAYDYRCEPCDAVFEVVRSVSDSTDVLCPTCDSMARRLFSPVGVVFKGSGFHSTDYRERGKESEKPKDSESPPCGGSDPCDSCPAKDA